MLWAHWFAAELRERNPGMSFAAQTVAEGQILHTFEALAETQKGQGPRQVIA
jgi:hypothetical protein